MEWTVLTLGRFSRNRYWGEDEGKAYRGPLCTSTLIRAPGANIIVDPALPPGEMEIALDGATGLSPAQIDIVYSTHAHNDHYYGLEVFGDARWLCAPAETQACKETLPPHMAAKVEAADAEIAPGVRLIELPGHTLGLAGLIFESRDGIVAVIGDAAMTRDFFEDRRGYFNSVDMELSAQSIEKVAKEADLIVPGHGNYFRVARA